MCNLSVEFCKEMMNCLLKSLCIMILVTVWRGETYNNGQRIGATSRTNSVVARTPERLDE